MDSTPDNEHMAPSGGQSKRPVPPQAAPPSTTPPSTAPPGPAPVAYAPPAAPVRQQGGFKRGFGLGAGAALGVGLMGLVAGVIGFALLAGLLSLVTAAAGDMETSSADAPLETVWGEDDAATTIRSVSVSGPILTDSASSGGIGLFGLATYGYDIAAQLDDIGKDDADAVVLELDTPGGTITGSKAIADAVQRYQERTGRPLVAFVRGISASGGMYAMAHADTIIADYGTLTGSIGVILGPISQYENVKAIDGGLLEGGVTTDGGITQEYFTQGKGKDFGNPWRAITPEERRVMTEGLEDEYDAFVQEVSEGRGIPAATIRNEIGAHVYSAQQAMDNGLVDEALGAGDAYGRIAEIAGGDPDDARVVEEGTGGFLSALTQARSSGPSPSADELDRAQQAIRRSDVCAGSVEVHAMQANVAICR